MNTVETKTDRTSILIVEDEALIADEIEDRLLGEGFAVVGRVATGPSAIRVATEERPDLVLMDIRLKGVMDGIAAAEHIHSQLGLPVVFLTAHSDQHTVQRAKATAPYGFLLKPFHERELIVTIEMALQRHGVERRLRESEARYRTTLENIGDGVIATDADGRVTYMNPVAQELTGWPATEALGRSIGEVFVVAENEGSTGSDHPVERVLRERETLRLQDDTCLVSREGELVPFDDSIAPIFDQGSSIQGAVLAMRDARQRRSDAEKLRRTEQMLLEAQKMEAVGRLAGGLAHDFNNLMTIVLGNTELMIESSQVDAQVLPLLLSIRGAGERAVVLTRQLLAYSRRQVMDVRVIEIGIIVADTVNLLQRLIGEDVVIVVRPSPRPIFARVDRGQLEQVLMNLAVNARDAMPGGGTLTIEIDPVEVSEEDGMPFGLQAGPFVRLAVIDTGTGMDEETRRHAFEPFFTTKSPETGTGLGLATVLGIVQQMNGGVEVQSAPGQGSAFTVLLPEVEAEKHSEAPSPVHEPVRGGGETVLLVEDEDGVRAICARALEGHGYRVLAATDAEHALEVLAASSIAIDILVTDLVMPGMNGRQLAERVRRHHPGLCTLFVSGYAHDVLRDEAKGSVEPLLLKPFTPLMLARRVREILDLGQQSSA